MVKKDMSGRMGRSRVWFCPRMLFCPADIIRTHYAAAVGLQKWKMTIMAKKWGDGTDVGGFSFVCFFADVQSEFKARSVLKIAARV